MSKFSAFLLLALVATAVVSQNPDVPDDHEEHHSLHECLDVPPHVFFDEEIIKEHTHETHEEIRRFPDDGYTPALITCIQVQNLHEEHEAGYVSVLEGGIGFNHVVLRFRGQEGRGFDFQVTLAYEDPQFPDNHHPHSINECSTEPDLHPAIYFDEEIHREPHHEENGVLEEVIRIPEEGYTDSVIACILVENLDAVHDQGYVQIVEGGVGHNHVVFVLRSQPSKGFDFQVILAVDEPEDPFHPDEPDHP